MPPSRFEPSIIKNKIKREEIANKNKKAKNQDKLQRRLARAKLEANDPTAKKKRLSTNVPRTLENMREFDPSFLTADPSSSSQTQDGPSSSSGEPSYDENAEDLASDPFAAYFNSEEDPNIPPKVLITTSPKASKPTYEFCDEIVGIFPGAEFIRRKKGKGFEVGRIAGWAAGRGYKHMVVGHARATPHNPELVLNNFVTRLGHTVGRMFQTLFPPLPEFQGRQVVTLHNQRDFLFFRRHRYAFKSPEKVALQEIGPRFTLKLRSLRKGIPAVFNLAEEPKGLEFDVDESKSSAEETLDSDENKQNAFEAPEKVVPPKQDNYLWKWKPELETTRRTFFL
ncbi:hypothetical protein HHX47_DHR6000746 [Lentinula edodes]|nr:hypothetical protein HHX47_DHR6000746 [Lentinula edodes]